MLVSVPMEKTLDHLEVILMQEKRDGTNERKRHVAHPRFGEESKSNRHDKNSQSYKEFVGVVVAFVGIEFKECLGKEFELLTIEGSSEHDHIAEA